MTSLWLVTCKRRLRGFEWHSKGQEFDSPMLHKISKISIISRLNRKEDGFFCSLFMTAKTEVTKREENLV